MKISISGSHGAGKTTLIEQAIKRRPSLKFHSEATRSLVPALGYISPYDIVETNGIAMYETMILASWNILSSPISNKSTNDYIDFIFLLDRSPVDNLAYYHVLRTQNEYQHEEFLTRLARHFLKYIDLHVFVPLLPFSVKLDSIQPKITQIDVQDKILSLYEALNVNYVTIQETNIDDRTNEILEIIDSEKTARTG